MCIHVFTVADHLIAQHNAIKMLHNRVRLVLRYIQAVHEGKVPRNHEILREAYSLCHRLPVLNTPRFREEFYNVSNHRTEEFQIPYTMMVGFNFFGEDVCLCIGVLKELAFLRTIHTHCSMLGVVAEPSVHAHMLTFQQCNDVSLMTYLGTLTKGCNDINQVRTLVFLVTYFWCLKHIKISLTLFDHF